jgi:PAS domain S-box-containing protein
MVFLQAAIGNSVTAPDGRLLEVNPAMAGMLGRTVEEMGCLDYAAITHPEDLAESRECVRTLLAGERETYRLRKRYLHVDGHHVWTLLDTRLVRAPDGTPLFFVTSVQDISDLVATEQALRKSETKFRELFYGAQVGMFRASSNCTAITAVNRRLCAMLGWTEEEITASPDRIDWEEPAQCKAMWDNLRSGGQVEGVETHLRNRAGKLLTVSVSMHLSADDAGVEASVVDLTELRAAQDLLAQRAAELERSNRDLEQFAYVASHDLQEPLRMVAGYTELLAERYRDRLDDLAQQFIALALDGVARMQALIEHLLQYARVASRHRPLTEISASACLDAALHVLESNIRATGAVVTSDELPSLPGDAMQLTSVFQNLVGNALKFHGPESPRVHVGVCDDLENWVFSVRDNGMGIPPQHHPRVFLLFQRFHSGQDHPGSGMGLSIVRRIVERHGGRAWFQSQPGSGATFFFSVPKRAAAQVGGGVEP